MTDKRIPLHPGVFIKRVYIDEAGLKAVDIAEALDVNKGTLSRLLNGHTSLTSDMAVRLSAVLGRSAESWMNMQTAHSLAKAKQIRERWKPVKVLAGDRLLTPKAASAKRKRMQQAAVA